MRVTLIPVIAAVLAIFPYLAQAGTDCRAIEYPDHFEAVCIGDEKATSPVNSAAPAQRSGAASPVSLQGMTASAEKITAAATPFQRDSSPQTAKADAGTSLFSYKAHRMQRAELEAKKAVRMKVIQEERERQPAPEP